MFQVLITRIPKSKKIKIAFTQKLHSKVTKAIRGQYKIPKV